LSRFLYYGWAVTFACVCLTSLYGVFLSFGVFLDPILKEFGWSNALTSAIYSIYWISNSFSAFFLGAYADRHSPRLVLALCGFLVGLGMALSSYATTVWQLYLTYGVIGGVGAGALWVAASITVMGWFKEERAMAWAVSVVAVGTGAGTVVMAPLGGFLITAFGWRLGFTYMALIVWLIVAAAMVIAKTPKTAPKVEKSDLGISGSFNQIRTTAFVCILLSYTLAAGAARQDMTLHVVSFLGTRGFTYSVGVITVAIIGVGSAVGRLLGGLVGRINEERILSLYFSLQGFSIFLFLISHAVFLVYSAAFLFGVVWGGSVPEIPLLLKRIFGMRHFGTIFGLVYFGVGVGAIIGPTFIGGYLFDVTRSYTVSLLLDGLVSFVAIVPLFSLSRQKLRRWL
jgi:MFS family permease